MAKITRLTEDFAVASQLAPEDFEAAAKSGFRLVVNNRPDGEERAQLDAAEGRELAEAQGLDYEHVPVTKHDIFTDENIGRTATAIDSADGPVLAHCKSGQRSAILWAAVMARRGVPPAELIATLKKADFDLAFLRDELDKQADFARWSGKQPEPAAAPRKTRATSSRSHAA